MIFQFANVIDAPALEAIREALADDGLWEDGAKTAAGRAREAKNNLQARLSASPVRAATEMISRTVLAHQGLGAAAIPAAIVRLLLSRSEAGMGYGSHVDAAYIDGVRTDLSFTVFLSDPGDYEGGELVIDSAGAEDSIKLAAGGLVLYPSTFVHRVETVRRGRRLAAVGWIRSHIKAAPHREVLYELSAAIADLDAAGAPVAVRDRLANLRNNLLRAFGD